MNLKFNQLANLHGIKNAQNCDEKSLVIFLLRSEEPDDVHLRYTSFIQYQDMSWYKMALDSSELSNISS